MDMNTVTTFITTVGFPIVCACVMFWYITKRDELDAEETRNHKEEMEALRGTIEKNTLVLQKLIDKIDGMGGEHS